MNSLTNGLFFIHPLLLYFSYILVLTYSLFSNQKSKVLKLIFSVTILAISLGAWWAQQELNWNGWWSWDFIEFLSFLVLLYCIFFYHNKNSPHNLQKNSIWFIFLLLILVVPRLGVVNSIHAFTLNAPTESIIYGLLGLFFIAIFFKQQLRQFNQNNVISLQSLIFLFIYVYYFYYYLNFFIVFFFNYLFIENTKLIIFLSFLLLTLIKIPCNFIWNGWAYPWFNFIWYKLIWNLKTNTIHFFIFLFLAATLTCNFNLYHPFSYVTELNINFQASYNLFNINLIALHNSLLINDYYFLLYKGLDVEFSMPCLELISSMLFFFKKNYIYFLSNHYLFGFYHFLWVFFFLFFFCYIYKNKKNYFLFFKIKKNNLF